MNIWTSGGFVFKPTNKIVSKIKLTIDNTKIDSGLTDFPINVSLSSSAGQTSFDVTDIFDTLVIYDNRKKIYAVDSGRSELFTEIERWDQDNEEANLWIKVPTIVSGTDTILYLYYSATIDKQTAYTGDVGDAPAQNVWDDYFTAVWHMSQDPVGGTNCIIDSTASGTHGTPDGAMDSNDLVDGKIGKGINFDGSNDLINCGTNAANDTTAALTVEAIFKTSEAKTQRMATKDDVDAPNRKYELHVNSTGSIAANVYQDNSTNANVNTDNGLGGSFIDGAYHYAAATINTNIPIITPIDGLYSDSDPTPTSKTLTSKPCLVDGADWIGDTSCEARLYDDDDSAGVDLGSIKTINGMAWGARGNVGSQTVFRYFGTDTDSMEIYKSNDNSTWTLAEQFTDMVVEEYWHPGGWGGIWVYWATRFSSPHTARYFKTNTTTFGPPKLINVPDGAGAHTLIMVEIYVFFDFADAKLYVDGVLNVTSTAELSSIQSQPSVPVLIGDSYNEADDYAFKGIIDEVRLSSIRRDAEWVKATYYSHWDDLITYSDLEVITISNYVGVYDSLTEALAGTIYHDANINSVWSNNDYLYIATTNSGILMSPMSSISGSVYNDLSVYKTYPDISNENVNYIHGAGNYLCIATISGAHIFDLTTNSGIYTNTSIIADKCHQLADRTTYYIYDDKLETVYNDNTTYIYQPGDGIIPTISGMNDLYVVGGTNNFILLGTTYGAVAIEENKGSEPLSRFKYYYIEE